MKNREACIAARLEQGGDEQFTRDLIEMTTERCVMQRRVAGVVFDGESFRREHVNGKTREMTVFSRSMERRVSGGIAQRQPRGSQDFGRKFAEHAHSGGGLKIVELRLRTHGRKK